jgi:pseudaminic acid synthase
VKTRNFKIGNSWIGLDKPAFIIAEMSGNHGGSIERALEIVRAAAKSGADAIKLQTYTADTITLNSKALDFQIRRGSWKEYGTLWQLYDAAHTPWEWHTEIFKEARRVGIECFSSPFDETAVDLLESLGAVAYKIASPEINHIPLLQRVAKTGKPVILSTGLASLADLNLAVNTLREFGAGELVILKCTSAYPAPVREANLSTIPDIVKRFQAVSGLSDHSIGSVVAVAALSLGAKVIEKHFNLENESETVDSFFSMDQSEFQRFVSDIRTAEDALGNITYDVSLSARKNLSGMRSLYVSAPIRAGETLTRENIRCVRPSFGLHPKYFGQVLGLRVLRDLDFGERLRLEDIEPI